MIGIATILVNANNAIHKKRKVNGCLFSAHFKFFTFSENIGTSANIINERGIHNNNIIKGLETIGLTMASTLIIFGRFGNRNNNAEKI